MSEWIGFLQRLPQQIDANKNGEVLLFETNGNVRAGMWNWIQPTRPDATQLWYANGFKAWKRIDEAKP